MEITKIVKILEENNFKYTLKNDVIVLNLEFSQNVIIDLSNAEKIIISDELANWNFLTGCIKMRLKSAMVYNFILLVVFGFICQYASFINQNYTSLFLVFITWIVLFTTFYLIKLESFKLQLIALTK